MSASVCRKPTDTRGRQRTCATPKWTRRSRLRAGRTNGSNVRASGASDKYLALKLMVPGNDDRECPDRMRPRLVGRYHQGIEHRRPMLDFARAAVLRRDATAGADVTSTAGPDTESSNKQSDQRNAAVR